MRHSRLSSSIVALLLVATACSWISACTRQHDIVDSQLMPSLNVTVSQTSSVPPGTITVAGACGFCLNSVEFYLDSVNQGVVSCRSDSSFPISAGAHVIQFQPSGSPGPVHIQVLEGAGVKVSVSCAAH